MHHQVKTGAGAQTQIRCQPDNQKRAQVCQAATYLDFGIWDHEIGSCGICDIPVLSTHKIWQQLVVQSGPSHSLQGVLPKCQQPALTHTYTQIHKS